MGFDSKFGVILRKNHKDLFKTIQTATQHREQNSAFKKNHPERALLASPAHHRTSNCPSKEEGVDKQHLRVLQLAAAKFREGELYRMWA